MHKRTANQIRVYADYQSCEQSFCSLWNPKTITKLNETDSIVNTDKGTRVFSCDRMPTTGCPHKQCVCLCSKYKEMYGRILKSLNIVNLYRGMSKLKLKINANVPQLLCIVVSVALNGEFERFGGFCIDCFYTL